MLFLSSFSILIIFFFIIFSNIPISISVTKNVENKESLPPISEFCDLSAFPSAAVKKYDFVFNKNEDQSVHFWNIVRQKTAANLNKFIRLSIDYCFKDVKAEGLARFDTKEINAENVEEILDKIYDWYQSSDLLKKDSAEEIERFEEVLKSLASFTVEHIFHAFGMVISNHKFDPNLIARQKFHIFDVGTGDGKFSEKILGAFLDEGFKADMTTIDLKENELNWNAQQANDQQQSNSSNDSIKDKFTKIEYDGTNLGEVIKNELERKREVEKLNTMRKEKNSNTIERIVITFNHSFHHWQTSKMQQQTMLELGRILPPGSVIFFKEHYSLMDDLQLTMIHTIFEAKSQIKKMNAERNKEAKISKDHSKVEVEKKQLKEHIAKYLRQNPHNYLSPMRLHQLMVAAGFELDCHTPEMPNHLNRTVYYVYKKKENFDPKMLQIQNKKFHSIDEMDAHLTIKNMKNVKFLSKKDRSKAPGIVWKTGSEYTLDNKEEGNKKKKQ